MCTIIRHTESTSSFRIIYDHSSSHRACDFCVERRVTLEAFLLHPHDCLTMTLLFVDPVLSGKASIFRWWAWVNVCARRGCSSTWHQQEERPNASECVCFTQQRSADTCFQCAHRPGRQTSVCFQRQSIFSLRFAFVMQSMLTYGVDSFNCNMTKSSWTSRSKETFSSRTGSHRPPCLSLLWARRHGLMRPISCPFFRLQNADLTQISTPRPHQFLNTCDVLGRGPLRCKWTCSAGMRLLVF